MSTQAKIILSDEQARAVAAHRYDYNSPDLDAILNRRLPYESVSGRFMVKMELARLSKECCRLIDLRGICPDAELFIYNGIKHYLNEPAQNEFLREVGLFKGYTHGVYEAVLSKSKCAINNFTVSENTVPSANIGSLTSFYVRKEQRLYCVSAISLFYSDPTKLSADKIKKADHEVITTDISQEGLCLKIGFQLPLDTKEVYLRFTGFEYEFSFSAPLLFKYSVLAHLQKNGFFYYKMKISENQDSSILTEFNEYLKKFIYSQSRRYKIPIENTHDAILVKGLEQYVVGKLHTLPIFIRHHEGRWEPEAVFITQENESVCFKLYDENHKQEFNNFISQKNIQAALNSGTRFSMYFLYAPVISPDDHAGFICIPLGECATNIEAMEIIKLAYSKSDGNLSLFRVEGMAINPEKECHIPSSLPDSSGEVFQLANRTPVERARILTSGFKRMITISDETELLSKMSIFSEPVEQEIPASAIYRFIPKKSKTTIEPFFVRNEIEDKRIEPRFNYKMLIHYHTEKNPREVYIAHTVDISTRGMQIDINNSASLAVGDIITLDFPSVPNGGEKYLISQPYRVVCIRGNLAHLTIHGHYQHHEGRKLMKKIILENINTLPVSGCKDGIYGLSRVIRNLFCFNHPFPKLFIKRLDKSRYVSDIAISRNSILPALSTNHDENIELLQLAMKNETFILLLNRAWMMLKKTEKQHAFHVLITTKEKIKQSGHYVTVRDADELIEDGRIKDYIEQANIIGNTRLIRVVLTKKNKVFNKYFKDELLYLTRFAPNRAKDALESISQVDAIASLLDITEHTKSLFI